MDPRQSVEPFDLDTEPTDTLHESQEYAAGSTGLFGIITSLPVFFEVVLCLAQRAGNLLFGILKLFW